MNRQERERILASLTDEELEELRSSTGDNADAPEDPSRQFLRTINAERDRDWIAQLADRLAVPSQRKPASGNHVSREGSDPGHPKVTDRQRLADFVRAITDPTHAPEL